MAGQSEGIVRCPRRRVGGTHVGVMAVDTTVRRSEGVSGEEKTLMTAR